VRNLGKRIGDCFKRNGEVHLRRTTTIRARLAAQILAKARAVKGSIRRNLRAFIEQGLQYEKVTIYTLQSIYNIE
jgi:hypothetical protein